MLKRRDTRFSAVILSVILFSMSFLLTSFTGTAFSGEEDGSPDSGQVLGDLIRSQFGEEVYDFWAQKNGRINTALFQIETQIKAGGMMAILTGEEPSAVPSQLKTLTAEENFQMGEYSSIADIYCQDLFGEFFTKYNHSPIRIGELDAENRETVKENLLALKNIFVERGGDFINDTILAHAKETAESRGEEPSGEEAYIFYFYQLENSLYLIENAYDLTDYLDLVDSIHYLNKGAEIFVTDNFLYDFQISYWHFNLGFYTSSMLYRHEIYENYTVADALLNLWRMLIVENAPEGLPEGVGEAIERISSLLDEHIDSDNEELDFTDEIIEEIEENAEIITEKFKE